MKLGHHSFSCSYNKVYQIRQIMSFLHETHSFRKSNITLQHKTTFSLQRLQNLEGERRRKMKFWSRKTNTEKVHSRKSKNYPFLYKKIIILNQFFRKFRTYDSIDRTYGNSLGQSKSPDPREAKGRRTWKYKNHSPNRFFSTKDKLFELW